MKKYFLLVVSVLLSGVMLLAGCGKNTNPIELPSLNAPVINNGGMTVQKGDYLYFINGFNSKTDLKAGDNDWGDIKHGAIYRTKLNDNKIAYDNDGFLKNVELIVPKLVGYDGGSFYIYGNYIYYSTPNNNVDKKGNSLTKLTDFYRVELNGKNNTLLYTSSTENLTQDDWTIYVIESEHYLVVKDGEKLVSVKSGKKVSKPVTMATDVKSASFVKYDTFYNNKRDVVDKFNNYIYYTRSARESDNLPANINGNFLARVKVNTNNEEVIYSAHTNTYTMFAVKNNSIYYTIANSNNLHSYLYKSEIANLNERVQLTNMNYDKLFVLDSDTEIVGKYVLGFHSNILYLLNGDKFEVVANEISSVLKVYGDQAIVLKSDGKLARINNVKDKNPTIIEFNLDGKTFKNDNHNFVDYDGRTIYIFVNYTSKSEQDNYYLNRIYTNTANPKTEFIGSFLEEHLPPKPDNEGKPEEEQEIWIK